MQAKAFTEKKEYILPARFDDTPIPGILQTIGYISLIELQPPEFVEIIQKKLVLSNTSIPSELYRKNRLLNFSKKTST